MLQLSKIFHFEMAHAIHGYPGACKNIHGHSYELQVTISPLQEYKDFIPSPGLIFDFKELKELVITNIIKSLDHKLLLSADYLAEHPGFYAPENLVTWNAEPTAENLLLYIQRVLSGKLPPSVKLAELKLFETKDSFAKWVNHDT